MRDDVGGAVLSKLGGMVSGDPVWSKTVFTRVIDSILAPDWLAHHHVMNRRWQSGGKCGDKRGDECEGNRGDKPRDKPGDK